MCALTVKSNFMTCIHVCDWPLNQILSGSAHLYIDKSCKLPIKCCFLTGEELSFVLSEVVEGEASHVWFGSLDTTNQNLRERTNCIVKYCMERGINDQSVLTTIVSKTFGNLPH